MIISVGYLLARCLPDGPMVLTRRELSKDAELLVLRHDNAVLHRQISRVRYQPGGRLWLAALPRPILRRRWGVWGARTLPLALTWVYRFKTDRMPPELGSCDRLRRPVVLVDHASEHLAPAEPAGPTGSWPGRRGRVVVAGGTGAGGARCNGRRTGRGLIASAVRRR
jgi:hypothetical protein